MRHMDAPMVIGFDGSDSATHAVRTPRPLLSTTSALTVTVWEPAFSTLPITTEGVVGIDMPLDPESQLLLDDASTERSTRIAAQGVRLAEELGLQAEAVTLQDELNVAETLAELASDRGAVAIVI